MCSKPDAWKVDFPLQRQEEIARQTMRRANFRFLDVAVLSSQRPDAHTGAVQGENGTDCFHWCLPGVPDVWNEVLLNFLAGRGRRFWSEENEFCPRVGHWDRPQQLV